jgi:parallel beta-helix repeat protein
MNTAKLILGALLLVFSLSFAVPVTTCGVISAPGTYDVLNDLTTATGDCIVIQADDVNLNCDAHSISATSGTSYAVYVTEGSDNVHVDRCLLENSMVGLRAGGDGSDPGSDVTLVNGLTLTYIVSRENTWAGFELIGLNGALIEHNTAYENGDHGFYMTESYGNTLQYNNEWLSRYDGFYLGSSSNNRLIGNAARQNDGPGFAVALYSDNNVLDSNTAEQNWNDAGFLVRGTGDARPVGNQLTNNIASGNNGGVQFVWTGSFNAAIGNTVTDNLGSGMLFTESPGVVITSNTLSGNARDLAMMGLLIFLCDDYIASDNTISGSSRGATILNSNMGSFDNNVISGSYEFPLLVQDSTSNEIVGNTVENSGPVQLRGDSTNTGVMWLTIRGPAGEVTIHMPIYDGNYDIDVASAPASPPSGYAPLGRYVSVAHMSADPADFIFLGIQYEDSDIGTLNESTATAMLWDGAWSNPAQRINLASNTVGMESPGFGIFGLFAMPPTPPEPPVTPPSGGHGTGGGSSGGTTSGSGSGGAVHVGVPFVPSGTTVVEEATPSCTSDSDCASSATCSGGICTALEAGSSCGTFENHEWVDYECCDTSDCSAGEVCKDNACTPLEPLVITPGEGTNTVASNEGIGRLLADVPWWVLALLLLMVGGGVYARYAMGREEPPEGEEGGEELPPAGEEEE